MRYRVHWVPGSDRLRAVCHCSAARDFEDRVVLWDWLLAHPAGHRPDPAAVPVPAAAGVS
ncbi:MAG: hypothetical protein ABWY11_22715 [Umezawaea sp.]